ncbi:Trypsin-like serine proteases, typically periplasmic, contain C-terminal PDZ domain [Paenibacillus uliginis N3/975]|uniref:Trypsin-like serine proteases, typically periplasmic, contain C-terminal PDZ domain n=1 Tax=Paenibacillus uliginis N3/975 TaxID=1313296 RepID=A0A1X7HSN9_9BACL|nr:trypsin-like peptidase domain-containing protein [Paenibacillus uliginis]SMF91366.1 Trypsin-like serine proteases, typically periplasmic, contain C-terminal PDZ domain [Paenibacillus uliginis N3/975]
MNKRILASFLSCIIILGAGAVGAVWVYVTVAKEGQQGPLLAAVDSVQTSQESKGGEAKANDVKSTSAQPDNDRGNDAKDQSSEKDLTVKEIIKQSQKKVFTVKTMDGLGSGFLFNRYGDLLTNAHVVEGYSDVTVTGLDKQEYAGTVIGIGASMDVAVIRVPGLAGKDPLPLETRNKAEVGDPVLALGSPHGLENTVTTGIISGLDREFELDQYVYSNLYQTSAPIAPGNSGGPLINSDTGKVVGINSAIMKQGTIGFSIPISQVAAMVEEWTGHQIDGTSNSTKTASAPNTASSAPASISKEEAEGLVIQYYLSLSVEDYVTAYSLLGSQWQKGTTYKQFREGYLNTQQVTVDYISALTGTGGKTEVSGLITAEERKNDVVSYRQYEVTYKIGYENGVLKMLKGSGKPLE